MHISTTHDSTETWIQSENSVEAGKAGCGVFDAINAAVTGRWVRGGLCWVSENEDEQIYARSSSYARRHAYYATMNVTTYRML